jgi:hypothetical protein
VRRQGPHPCSLLGAELVVVDSWQTSRVVGVDVDGGGVSRIIRR